LPGGSFIVNYQNGARGSTLTNGSKTTTPVPYDKAITIFDKLVKEKMTGSSKYRVSDGVAPVPIPVPFERPVQLQSFSYSGSN
jgi:hypothetical protein